MNMDRELPPAVAALSRWAREFQAECNAVNVALMRCARARESPETEIADSVAFAILTKLHDRFRDHWMMPLDGLTHRASCEALADIQPLWQRVALARYAVHKRLPYRAGYLGDRPPL